MIDNPPFRLKILRKITETLKAVTPANGYSVDLSDTEHAKRVVRGRLTLGSGDEDTIVSIIEPPTAVDQITQRAPDNVQSATEWDILIQGWTKNTRDDEPCDPAYVLAAEVRRALAAEKERLKTSQTGVWLFGFREITDMQIGAPVVRPSEEVSDFGVFYIILTLKFVEDMAKPFG